MSSASLLARLGASANDVARLAEPDRLAVIHLLLEWGAVEDALACLAWTAADAGDEWRMPAIDALRRAGRYGEALELVENLRTAGLIRDAQRARTLAAAGHQAEALALAEGLAETTTGGGRSEAWTLLGDIHLAGGSVSDAEVAYTQAARIDAHDPAPQVGLLRAALAVGAGAEVARVLLDDRGVAALRSDELNLVAGALRDGGAEVVPALRLVENELLERYDRAQARLRQILARKMPVAEALPSTKADALSVPGASAHLHLGAPAAGAHELNELRLAVRKIFGFHALLPVQADVIAASRRGEDLLAVMPTGGGKSLCYQLPAFLDGGLTLVISPLVALMKDQVDQLPARLRPSAVALHGGVEPAQVQAALEGMAAGKYRLVYVAPERLRQRTFVAALRQVGVARMVIDEAHCVAVWGHDFRPDYLHLPRVHADLGAPPLLALTATAPPALRRQIEAQLFGAGEQQRRPYQVYVADPTRANLWLGVRLLKGDGERRERLVSLAASLPGAGIVYMRSRAQTEDVAAALRAAGVEAAAYHAGLPNRTAVQDRFMQGALRVIVATVAFGMGVNKPDIRFVLHGGLPNSLESYVQEVGRAGRDGNPAVCLLLTTERDLSYAGQSSGQSDDAPVALLQGVLQAVTQAVGANRSGLLAIDEVALALGADDTAVRVALSMLEEAGLVSRDYDAPRSVSLYLRKAGRSVDLTRFVQASGVAPGKPAEWPFADLAAATGLAPAQLEEKLLVWQEAG
ncbi:MAG: RecQ family ATP-dependent DNA helicase, partial [Caldilineaceae bacterium]